MPTQLANRAAPAYEPTRTGRSAEALQRAVLDNLAFVQATPPAYATKHDWYLALAYSVRDRLLARWVGSVETYARSDVKVACYLSAEFLIGPQLGSNLLALGIEHEARAAMTALGKDLDELLALEEEPGLGNGGLGRLAACYMDSLATLEVPAIGYGIRYEFGIFDQQIRDGWQVELTDKWLERGNAWEIVRPSVRYYVNFGGRTEAWTDEAGRYRVRWVPSGQVKGVACDTPVAGYRVNTCNTLRLWKSEAVESFDLQDFNVGDYYGAVQAKLVSETLSKVLYPNDEPEIGKRLRLAQQYFFVSCSLQDMLHLLDLKGEPIGRFAEPVCGPAERHAPGHRGGRADAAAGGRTPAALGRGLGHHAAHVRLHQPHAAAGGSGNVGAEALREAAAAADARSSTRSTAASSTRCAAGSPATRRACSGCR